MLDDIGFLIKEFSFARPLSPETLREGDPPIVKSTPFFSTLQNGEIKKGLYYSSNSDRTIKAEILPSLFFQHLSIFKYCSSVTIFG